MDDDRPEPRVLALTFLVPAMFGLHSLLVPWVAVDDDGADEVYSWWATRFMNSFDDTAYGIWWLLVGALGVAVLVGCLVRAFSPDAPRSYVLAGLATLLALGLLALPFVLQSVLPRGEEDVVVAWGGPATAALAALWVAGAALTGVPRRSSGWERSRAPQRGWARD